MEDDEDSEEFTLGSEPRVQIQGGGSVTERLTRLETAVRQGMPDRKEARFYRDIQRRSLWADEDITDEDLKKRASSVGKYQCQQMDKADRRSQFGKWLWRGVYGTVLLIAPPLFEIIRDYIKGH